MFSLVCALMFLAGNVLFARAWNTWYLVALLVAGKVTPSVVDKIPRYAEHRFPPLDAITPAALTLPGERLGVEDDGHTSDGQDGCSDPAPSYARQQAGFAAAHMSGLPQGAGSTAIQQ